MKLRFEFDTAKTVPLYDKLLQQLLRHPQVKAVARTDTGYSLDSEGNQAELEALADLISQAIPLSCWLTDSRLLPIDELGEHSGNLTDYHGHLPYCRHCWQHPEDNCPVCGAQALTLELPLDDFIRQHQQQLLQSGQTHYQAGRNHITLMRLSANHPLPYQNHYGLLFTEPRALNQALYINDAEIKLLGSIEKPRLLLEAKTQFCQQHGLEIGRYSVQQAHDRLTLALAGSLKTAGISVVAIKQNQAPLLLTAYGEQWAVLSDPNLPAPFASHEPKQRQVELLGVQARWDQDGFIKLRYSDNMQAPAPHLAAAYALEGVRQRDRVPKRSAVLFLSRSAHSGLLFRHSNNETAASEYQWWVRLPQAAEAPFSATAMLDLIRNSDNGARLLQRYQAVDSDHLAFLRQLPVHSTDLSFTGFMALAAWFAGLSTSDDPQKAANALLSLAYQFGDRSAPRIDYSVQRNNDALIVRWERALQACLSFRLADPDLKAGVAFGVIDSFCDFVCQWVEQLDAEVGIDEVILAGDEFDNAVLLERLRLRLGKNMALRLPNDFGPATLAIGALFVDQE